MAFDVAGAREAGYSDLEIANHLSRGADFDVQGAIDAGYSPLDIISHLNPEERPLFLAQQESFLRVFLVALHLALPRQVGSCRAYRCRSKSRWFRGRNH